jgi:hypothetical protein
MKFEQNFLIYFIQPKYIYLKIKLSGKIKFMGVDLELVAIDIHYT